MEGFSNPYIDKLVGASEPGLEKFWNNEVNDLVENIGAEIVDGFELLKTKRDNEIIAFAEKAVDEIMLKYGRIKRIPIPNNNIHILKNGGTKEYTKGRLINGAASIRQKSLIVDRAPSDSEFAVMLFHELTHLKSYSALQVVDSGEGDELETYRSGIAVVSRDNTEKYLESIEEAIVGYLTQTFYDSYIKNSPEFRDEKNGSVLEISRQNELKNLNTVVEMIFTKNRETFSSRDEIFALFIDAQINGNILPVGKLIDKTFGTGAIKQLDIRKI